MAIGDDIVDAAANADLESGNAIASALDQIKTVDDLYKSAKMDPDKLRQAAMNLIQDKLKDPSDLVTSKEDAAARAAANLKAWEAYQDLVTKRNTLNIEKRRKAPGTPGRGDPRKFIDVINKRLRLLEMEVGNSNPEGELVAVAEEIQTLSLSELESMHAVTVDIRKIVETANKVGGASVKIVRIRGYVPHKHFLKPPETSTQEVLATDQDHRRTRMMANFYGIIDCSAIPNVKDLIRVRFPDENDFAVGIYLGLKLSMAYVKPPPGAKDAFK